MTITDSIRTVHMTITDLIRTLHMTITDSIRTMHMTVTDLIRTMHMTITDSMFGNDTTQGNGYGLGYSDVCCGTALACAYSSGSNSNVYLK